MQRDVEEKGRGNPREICNDVKECADVGVRVCKHLQREEH